MHLYRGSQDSDRGPWNLSHTRAVERAFPVQWFIERGQKIVSNKTLGHWFEIERWVKLA